MCHSYLRVTVVVHRTGASVSDQEETSTSTTRRTFMVGGAAAIGAAAATGLGKAGKVTDAQARLVDKLVAASTTNASLSDIKHVVILMQENRSFDHYFGTLSGVAGFSDPNVLANPAGGTVFDQYGFQPGTGVTSTGYMQPFNLLNNPPTQDGSDTNDISHAWTTLHQAWNNGKMDQFINAHLAAD